MTSGSIVKHIINFALPLLVGYAFQQLYNTVDTWVVGNYVSNEAFSAVGSVGPIINMLIGTFTGLASGAGVVISQEYGAKKFDEVKKSVHTSLLLTFILGILFTALGIIITPAMLNFMKTPTEVFGEASQYLTIYFSGILGLMIYNMGSGILRAVGDSVRPLLYLVVSALVNTVLDLVFVLVFKMGVDGVAWATVIAQCASALLVIIELLTTKSCVKIQFKALKIHASSLKQILYIGVPAAIQMAVTAFSNVFVQSYINYFGTDFMSGWTAYGKIDQIILLPMQAISLAATTFVGQNLGNDDAKRAKHGADIALLMAVAATIIIMIPVLIFAPQLTAFFNQKTEVINFGALLLRLISPFYILCCVNQIYAAALRGAGKSTMPMIIMLFSFVLFRQIYLFVMANFISNSIIPIALAYPAGWLVASIITIIYYKKTDFKRTVIG